MATKKKTVKKRKAAEAASSPAVLADGSAERAEDQAEGPGEKTRAWSFPTRSRCPRCAAADTVATTTRGPTQYRRCTRATCRFRYTVRGTEI